VTLTSGDRDGTITAMTTASRPGHRTREETARTLRMVECDHMRALVRIDGTWHHLNNDGAIGSPCGASSGYIVTATITGQHTVPAAFRDTPAAADHGPDAAPTGQPRPSTVQPAQQRGWAGGTP
jgi:hypothetical protein